MRILNLCPLLARCTGPDLHYSLDAYQKEKGQENEDLRSYSGLKSLRDRPFDQFKFLKIVRRMWELIK